MADLKIEVWLGLPDGAWCRQVLCPAGTTCLEAAQRSGLLALARERGVAIVALGVYGKRVAPDTEVRAHDRLELYRALIADPKSARRRRVAHQNPAGR